MNTPDVTVTISDFGMATATGVAVQLAPNAVFGPVDTSHLKASTNSSGVATFSAIPPGQYILSIFTTGGASYTLIVPNQSATVAAFDHIVSEFHLPEVVVEPGSKEGEGDPTDSVTPDFSGQLYHDTEADSYYRSTGTTSADWAAISGGSDYQDMQVAWEPTNLNISELSGVQFGPNGNGITSITFNMATSAGTVLINNVWASLVSVSGPNLTAITGSGSLSFRNGGGLVSVDFPLLVSVAGQIGINSLPFLTTVNLPLLETCKDIDFDSCTTLVSLSLPELTSSGTSGSYNDFSGCTLLANVSFPKWVIDDGATLIFTGDALSAASVNHILARCVASAGFVSGSVDLSGGTSAAPSGQGATDKTTLTGRGVTVTTN